MKKRNLKSLRLNKKSISNFKIKGGRPATSIDLPCTVDQSVGCDISDDNTFLSRVAGIVCITWN